MQHSYFYPDVADSSGVTLLTRKRIYILSTRHGLAFAIALTVMLAGSMNYKSALGFALTFLLVSLALVSLLHTYRNLAGLRASAHPAPPVFAGDMARFLVTIDNPGGPRRDGVVITEQRATYDSVVHLQLSPDSTARMALPVASDARGWRKLDRVCIASRALFGIFRVWYRVPTAVRSIVYPHPSGDLPLPVHDAESGAEGGRGGSGREDFAGLRDYRRGDSVHHIQWKAAARRGVLAVKLFDGARTGNVRLRFVDIPIADTEQRFSQLTVWVLAAEIDGLHYTLELPGATPTSTTEPDSGPTHRDQCLLRLALFGLEQ
jgi:uncharacterized protein (DUF58 family)